VDRHAPFLVVIQNFFDDHSGISHAILLAFVIGEYGDAQNEDNDQAATSFFIIHSLQDYSDYSKEKPSYS
jgi:hypothetical protein